MTPKKNTLMALWFYKWLVGGLLSSRLATATPPDAHPFHVSVTEINHNGSDKTLEISCKLFVDDFERALLEAYKTKVDLINPSNRANMDSLVKKYITGHLGIRVNGATKNLHYLGFEHEKESVYAYLEITGAGDLTRLDISNSLMYDLFDDQVNILHVVEKGNRRSTRVSYPEKESGFSWYLYSSISSFNSSLRVTSTLSMR